MQDLNNHNLVHLALQRLNLGSQCLHLLRLRRNRPGLLCDQVLDLSDLPVDDAGGQAWLAGREGSSGGL